MYFIDIGALFVDKNLNFNSTSIILAFYSYRLLADTCLRRPSFRTIFSNVFTIRAPRPSDDFLLSPVALHNLTGVH